MRILDLGCGASTNLNAWGVSEADQITGVDPDEPSLAIAKQKFPNRTYLSGCGEAIPCEDESFERVISSLALYYMNVPKALSEISRVLVPGGRVSMGLMFADFTLTELRQFAFPHFVPTVFKTWVLANGCWFHMTGKNMRFISGRTEAFHTERGIRIALARAGFTSPTFSCHQGVMSKVHVVESTKN